MWEKFDKFCEVNELKIRKELEMIIIDLKVSVILLYSGYKNGKRKKVIDCKSVGKKVIINFVCEKRK